MTLYEYVQAVLRLNRAAIKPQSNARVFSSYTWGVIEEILEYVAAETPEKDIEEAGDVFCYCVLVLLSMEWLNPTHFSTGVWEENICQAVANILDGGIAEGDSLNNVLSAGKRYSARMKRYYREGVQIDMDLVADVFATTKDSVLSLDNTLELSDILENNIDKLEGRAQRGTLFAGSGER